MWKEQVPEGGSHGAGGSLLLGGREVSHLRQVTEPGRKSGGKDLYPPGVL